MKNVEQMRKLARLQFVPSEAEILLDMDEGSIEASESLHTEFIRARLQAQQEVRQAMLELATNGTSQAVSQFQKLAEPLVESE